MKTTRQPEATTYTPPSPSRATAPPPTHTKHGLGRSFFEQELAEVVREFSDEGRLGPRGDNMVLYDDFVDMLVVGSPRCETINFFFCLRFIFCTLEIFSSMV